MTVLPRLYAIADASFGDPVQLTQSLILGGARLIQLRNKQAGAREFLDQVERVLALAPPDVRIIVNDRVDVARIAGARGVHLGQTDVPPAEARKILGFDCIIGFSTHSLSQALEADRFPVDYIAVGPVFPTSTKQNPDPVVGLHGLAAIAKAVPKPIVAVGGIRLENAEEVLQAGADSIAVIRDLLDCADVEARTRAWIEVVNRS
ncbi:MAG TPA: thiamine phosphate synthase [Terriglobia bacterium]|nr:thiamine phosphate synthase [Terriglobia bacterium]